MIDLPDVLLTLGVIAIAVALYLVFGVAAVLAFIGTVLIVVGIVAAWKRAQKPAR